MQLLAPLVELLSALQLELQHQFVEELLCWFAAGEAQPSLMWQLWAEVQAEAQAAAAQLVVYPGQHCPGWQLSAVCGGIPVQAPLSLVLALHYLLQVFHGHCALGQQLTVGPCLGCQLIPRGAL